MPFIQEPRRGLSPRASAWSPSGRKPHRAMDPNEKARGAGGSQEPDPRGTSVALAAVPDPPVIGRGAQPSVLPQPPIINQQQINPFHVEGLPTPFSRPPMQAPSHPPAHPPACQSGGAGSSASVAPPLCDGIILGFLRGRRAVC